ncbi:hypothetical protein SAMN02910358_00605 [Lachnospiraceae bacterium XBB1006]|nr:hypothetical protein SAMN02910358_00605 [Lachnospiraceae bacterium XBB1006]
MERKVVRLSLMSVLGGIIVSILSMYMPMMKLKELISYFGATMILGGAVYLDKAVLVAVYGEGKPPVRSLLRLAVYMALAIVLLLAPTKIAMPDCGMRVSKAVGTACLLLSLLKFFIYTTMEEQSLHE